MNNLPLNTFELSTEHNYFEFSFLPSVLNDIINRNCEEQLYIQYKTEHITHFQKSLDLIKVIKKEYDISHYGGETMGFVSFGDIDIIFTFPIENEYQFNSLLECIDDNTHNFNINREGDIETDEDEVVDLDIDTDTEMN